MHFKSETYYDSKYLKKWYQYKTNNYIDHVNNAVAFIIQVT